MRPLLYGDPMARRLLMVSVLLASSAAGAPASMMFTSGLAFLSAVNGQRPANSTMAPGAANFTGEPQKEMAAVAVCLVGEPR